VLQRADDVAGLRFQHEDHAVGPDIGVGAVQHEEVGKTGNGHAQIRVRTVAPCLPQRHSALADDVDLAQIVGRRIAGSAQHDVDIELGAVGGHQRTGAQ
jgi:hypothetical protein